MKSFEPYLEIANRDSFNWNFVRLNSSGLTHLCNELSSNEIFLNKFGKIDEPPALLGLAREKINLAIINYKFTNPEYIEYSKCISNYLVA